MDHSDSDDDRVLFQNTIRLWGAYQDLSSEPYVFRTPSNRGSGVSDETWREILNDRDKYWDEEFLRLFRCSRDHFGRILDMIRDHNSMKSTGRHKLHPELMLLVTLKFLGSEGNAASADRVKEGLGIKGKGTVQNYCDRTIEALLSLEKTTLFWPDEKERELISERIKQQYKLGGLVRYTTIAYSGIVTFLRILKSTLARKNMAWGILHSRTLCS